MLLVVVFLILKHGTLKQHGHSVLVPRNLGHSLSSEAASLLMLTRGGGTNSNPILNDLNGN